MTRISPNAQAIVDQRMPLWPYLLFAQLLADAQDADDASANAALLADTRLDVGGSDGLSGLSEPITWKFAVQLQLQEL